MLSRRFQLAPSHLDTIASGWSPLNWRMSTQRLIFPRQFNAYHQKNPDWEARMRTLFGLNVAKGVPRLRW